MSATSFCVGFVATGLVLGLSLNNTPDEWDSRLGDREFPLVDVRKGRMRRDYGLIEVHFEKAEPGWRCLGINLEIHRLASNDYDVVPPGLRAYIGPADGTVMTADVLAGLDARAIPYERSSRTMSENSVAYWIPSSGVFLVADGDMSSAVWSAATTVNAGQWAAS